MSHSYQKYFGYKYTLSLILSVFGNNNAGANVRLPTFNMNSELSASSDRMVNCGTRPKGKLPDFLRHNICPPKHHGILIEITQVSNANLAPLTERVLTEKKILLIYS